MRLLLYYIWRGLLTLYGVILFGRRGLAISRFMHMVVSRWAELAGREPTDSETERLGNRTYLFTTTYGRTPTVEETDAIIRQILEFPT